MKLDPTNPRDVMTAVCIARWRQTPIGTPYHRIVSDYIDIIGPPETIMDPDEFEDFCNAHNVC